MKLNDWLKLSQEERVKAFEDVLGSIKDFTEDEIEDITVWFINTLSNEEMKSIIDREGRDAIYLENLDVLNLYLFESTMKCTQLAMGVKLI